MPRTQRYPNFTAFIATGAILGFVVGSAFAYFGDDVQRYSPGTAVAFIGLFGACVFGMAAAVLAVLLDRRR